MILGCGYLGGHLARLLAAEGIATLAVSRSRPAHLPAGVAHAVADLDDPASLASLSFEDQTLFYLAPPPGEGADDPRVAHLVEHLETTGQRPAAIVYTSTSGVYGDCRGERVTEEWEPNPGTDRARRRVAAETTLRAFGERTGVPVMILRVSGIYGPGRLPLERIRRGDPVICPEQATPSNRIHVTDLAATCLAAARQGRPGGIYNVCDDRTSSMTDYFYRVADAAGLPRPPCISMAEAEDRLSPMLLSFLRESRRLDNRRLHEELGVELGYPTLDEGIPASLAE